jgi:hypothetical protein
MYLIQMTFMIQTLLLTNNNVTKLMKTNWKKQMCINNTSYLDSLESKMKLNLNNSEKRIERDVSRHSPKSKQLRSFNKRCML